MHTKKKEKKKEENNNNQCKFDLTFNSYLDCKAQSKTDWFSWFVLIAVMKITSLTLFITHYFDSGVAKV
jgi:hypothetical protein